MITAKRDTSSAISQGTVLIRIICALLVAVCIICIWFANLQYGKANNYRQSADSRAMRLCRKELISIGSSLSVASLCFGNTGYCNAIDDILYSCQYIKGLCTLSESVEINSIESYVTLLFERVSSLPRELSPRCREFCRLLGALNTDVTDALSENEDVSVYCKTLEELSYKSYSESAAGGQSKSSIGTE